jgi:peptidoglycan/xylan/chitin deacetylase (PgdA/CDA1 family)
MLVASQPLLVLDTFRVPYRVEGSDADGATGGRIRAANGAELMWLRPSEAIRTWHRVAGVSMFGAVASEEEVHRVLEGARRDWRATDAVLLDDSTVANVWRADDGSTLLPFDPNSLVRSLLMEEYVRADGMTPVFRRVYYRLRPLLPRSLQMALRRRFVRVQEHSSFPAWPAETALHDLYAYLVRLLEDVHGSPLPWIAPWPAPYRWPVVLTHDVERAGGYAHLGAVVAIERAAGVRSAWYFVPERDYRVDSDLLQELTAEGFEVCVHGLQHDGNDLSAHGFDERLPRMRAYARRWGAVGFRSPATQRDWSRISRLGFDHDSSYSDVARYEPQAGGSCSWYPFFVGDVVELPITLPMDHTLFDLLGHADGRVWFEKAAFVRERGGMGLLLTHPDYLIDPARLQEYERFVTHVSGDTTAWIALPRDVSDWWRRRAASTLEPSGDTWHVVGPAAGEARVMLGFSGL